MFNGIINYIGTVKNIKKIKKVLSININSKLPLKQNEIGSSISCSGACLTLTNLKKNISTFYVSQETLKVTNLSLLKISSECPPKPTVQSIYIPSGTVTKFFTTSSHKMGTWCFIGS